MLTKRFELIRYKDVEILVDKKNLRIFTVNKVWIDLNYLVMC